MKEINLDSSVINQKKQKAPAKEVPDTTSQPDTMQGKVAASSADSNQKKPSIFKRIGAIPRNSIAWFKARTPFQKILITGVFCLLVLGIGGAAMYQFVLNEGSTTELTIVKLVSAESPSSITYVTAIPISDPNPPRDTPNPINGELYTKAEYEAFSSKYPIAVMIENHISARPQSGYNSADLVFETLAEGGITRTMAIFWGHDVSEIGPVRSARQYFIEWLMPFDPLYMHIGYAYTDDPRTDAGGSIYTYGIKSMDRGGTFWRSSERYAPHNAYTSTELLYEQAERVGYTGTPSEIESWKFKRDAPIDQRGSESTANLTFFDRLNNGGLYDVTWRYDRERNVYLRSNYDTPYTDVGTDSQIYAKNIIIQRVETMSAYDEKARMIITTIGEGDAIILRDGVVINGTWKKDDITSRTRYFDSEGNEIELNRGITWIEAVPIDQGTVQIEP